MKIKFLATPSCKVKMVIKMLKVIYAYEGK